MNKNEIQKAILGHQIRNATLIKLLTEKGINLKEPRAIECHLYAKTKRDADALAVALASRGFRILVNRQSASRNGALWNVEAAVTQSVDLTTRREFIDELVRLANEYDALNTANTKQYSTNWQVNFRGSVRTSLLSLAQKSLSGNL